MVFLIGIVTIYDSSANFRKGKSLNDLCREQSNILSLYLVVLLSEVNLNLYFIKRNLKGRTTPYCNSPFGARVATTCQK